MTDQMARTLYQIRNWRSHARALLLGATRTFQVALPRAFGAGELFATYTIKSELSAKIIRSGARDLNLGVVGRRVVTTVGVKFVADTFNAHANAADLQNMKFMDS